MKCEHCRRRQAVTVASVPDGLGRLRTGRVCRQCERECDALLLSAARGVAAVDRAVSAAHTASARQPGGWLRPPDRRAA